MTVVLLPNNRSGSAKLLKWAGSKSNVSAQIVKFLDFGKPYIEPFCGSAAFFFECNPASAHLNDLNSHLIHFYKMVQTSPDEVWTEYDQIPVNEANYYETRKKFNDSEPSIETAAQFAYLNHFSFNGIYRTNKGGQFNTPFGARDKEKKKLTREQFVAFSKQMSAASFHSLDFEVFLSQLAPVNACIYMDPPYFTREVRVFNEYGAKLFSGDDLERLLRVCVNLSTNNKIVLSYRDCSEFNELFGQYIVGKISVTRNVGGFAGRRKIESEQLAVMG